MQVVLSKKVNETQVGTTRKEEPNVKTAFSEIKENETKTNDSKEKTEASQGKHKKYTRLIYQNPEDKLNITSETSI